MYINKVHYPEFPDTCFLKPSYTGTQNYDTQYLGYDRQLPFLPKVTLTARFDNMPIPDASTGIIPNDQLPNEVDGLMQWWKDECKRGVEVFILKDIRLFGAVSNYGVRFITPLVHKVVEGGDEVSFTVEVLFDEKSLDNLAPTALDFTLQVGENTRDNYILLKGLDPELDGLTYEVVLPPAHGVIRESGRVILYTPFDGYKGDDCFNFVVKDRFNISKYATVGIAVGDTTHVDAEFIYTIDGNVDKFVVLGNYHWQYLDTSTNQRINYSTGETIKRPNANTNPWQIRIWSDDSEIATPSLDAVNEIQVINWGDREYYQSFFANMPNINALTTAGAVGSCKGVNFDFAFDNFPLDIPKIDMSHGVYFRDTFRGTSGYTMVELTFTEAKYCQRMFQGTKIKNIPEIILPKVDYAQDMFKNCDVFCLEGLDVTNAISTGGIMTNARFTHQPDPSIIAEFESDARRRFSGAKCGSVAGEIVLTKRTNAVIPKPGDTGTAKLEVEITPSNTQGVVKFMWHTNNGTFTGGSEHAKKGVLEIIDVPIGNHSVTVWCDVIDDKGTTTSAKFSFMYKGVADYLELNIPKQSKPLNLTTYIKANNPANKTEIYLLNDRVNCQFITGTLAGLNVTLHNTGEIQAFSRPDGNVSGPNEKAALIVEGPLMLVNDGWIRGCGGKGGDGGKGANSKYKKTHTEERYNFGCGNGNSWSDHVYSNTATIVWGNEWVNVTNKGGGPAKHPKYPGALFYRGKYKCSACCDTAAKFYSIKKVTYTWHTTTGGNGGTGGQGQGYLVPAKNGSAGKVSNPKVGNSGGRGGKGGVWGTVGDKGANNGSNGLTGGNAIMGKSNLAVGSFEGNCSGAVV